MSQQTEDGSEDQPEPNENDVHKASRTTVFNYCSQLGVPFNVKPISTWSANACTQALRALKASDSEVSEFNAWDLTSRREFLKRVVYSYRSHLIHKCSAQSDEFSIDTMRSFLRWKDLTSVNVRPRKRARSPPAVGRTHAEGGSPKKRKPPGKTIPSGQQPSPSKVDILAELQNLRNHVQKLDRERSAAPEDDDYDRAAGGNRIELSAALVERLPPDPVRAELEKREVSAILRDYPPPRQYYLKGGVLSADEKGKLDPKVAEEHLKLGKSIAKYSEIARPLLGLMSSLQTGLDAGDTVVDCSSVLDVCFDTLNLLFHHNSVVEKERRMLQFKDSKVLQSVFQKAPIKSMLNEKELTALSKIAEEQKVIRKIREDARPPKKNLRTRPGGRTQPQPRKPGGNPRPQSGLNFGSGSGQDAFRTPSRGDGRAGKDGFNKRRTTPSNKEPAKRGEHKDSSAQGK